MLGQVAGRVNRGWSWVLLLTREVWELPDTHWNLILASSRKCVSKSQRKKRSRLEGGEEEQLRKRGSHRAISAAPSRRVLSPAPDGRHPLDPTPTEQPLLPHGTTAA